jgi:hypothetical protein
MRRGPIIAAIVVGLAAMCPSPAFAQEPSHYDRLVDEALSEFEAGHYEEALSVFEQAYEERPSARALRGVAKALFELRAYARCIVAIDRALASDVDPLPESLRADLESLKARALTFVGEATIEVTPSHATLFLDGQAITPGNARTLEVGTHTVEASAPDHHPQVRRFEIHGRQTTKVAITLEPVRLAPPVAEPVTASDNRTLPLVLSVGALVLSTGAIVGSSIWLVDRADAVDRCNGAAASGARCANEGSIAFQKNAATGTVVLSAGALAVSAVALWFVLRGDKRAPPPMAAMAAMAF